jgi:hypothetical protein
VGHDTVAVAGARVVLHRVTVQRPGPVDSAISDPRGRFAFNVTPDTDAVYLISARWSGIEYFATPLAIRQGSAGMNVLVTVADTSAAAPVHLAARHLIVSPVTADGVRDVVDLFVLENTGTLTRVTHDSLRATWRVRLPHFAINVHGGNSGFSLESLRLVGDTVGLYAAIPPGQHDIEIDYQMPPGTREFELPVDDGAAVSNIISEDRGMAVRGSFTRSDTVIAGKPYARWQGRLVAGEPVALVFGGGPTPGWIIPVLALAMAAVLVGTTVMVMRR